MYSFVRYFLKAGSKALFKGIMIGSLIYCVYAIFHLGDPHQGITHHMELVKKEHQRSESTTMTTVTSPKESVSPNSNQLSTKKYDVSTKRAEHFEAEESPEQTAIEQPKQSPESGDAVVSCRDVHLSPEPLPMVALASHPGAGNTWARHLLQQTTGIYTGSVYKDLLMETEEFPYNRLFDGTACPIKTHRRPDNPRIKSFKFEKGILLIRNPYDCFKANFNRGISGKLGIINPKTFKLPKWLSFIKKTKYTWTNHAVAWMTSPKPVFLLKFDDLKFNLTSTLKAAAEFLNLGTSTEILECTKRNSEGAFHRVKKANETDMLVFDEAFKEEMDKKIAIVNWYIQRRCPKSPRCLPYDQVDFSDQPFELPHPNHPSGIH